MMRVPEINQRIKIEQLNVYPGEYLTVWLNRYPQSGERDADQVELRVLLDGTLQIFVEKTTRVFDFEEWTNPEVTP